MHPLSSTLANLRHAGAQRWRQLVVWLGLPHASTGIDAPVHRRVRLAMYTVLLVVGGVSAWQAWRIERSEAVRLTDAGLIRVAATQGLLAQRMGMLAASMGLNDGQYARHRQVLEDLLRKAQDEADQLEVLLLRQGVWSPGADPALRQTAFSWLDGREQLWSDIQLLLWDAPVADRSRLLEAIRDVQAEAESSLVASQQLLEQVQRAAQGRARAAVTQVEVSAVGMLLLLLLLLLGVAEPLARFVRRQHQALVQQSQEVQRLALVAQRTSNWVAVLDLDRRVLWANQAFLNAKGRTLEQAVGNLPELLVVNEHASEAEVERLRERLRQGLGVRAELMNILPSGLEVWLEVDYQPMHDQAGVLTGFTVVATDITDQRSQRKLLELAIEGASLGLWQWDIESGAMSCNDRLLELYGYERSSFSMRVEDWTAIIHPEDLEGWLWAIRTNLRDSKQALYWEIRIRHGSSGRWIWMMYSGTVVARGPDGRALRMAGICYDINAQKELEDQLRQAARTDSLTRLPNRIELLNRIHASIERSRQRSSYHFAVLFMDFDRFKQVNDTLGHSVGDELLRQIAQRLQDSLRPGDAFVQTSDFSQMAARIGGDEFVVLLDDIRGDLDAQVVATRLLETLSEPYQIGQHKVSSTASIGIVTTEHMAEDPDSVLRDADIAMYEAKREGRGRYVMFDPAMRKRLRDDVSLENDLRQAFHGDQLYVVYQPLVDLRTGELAGTEALVRWRHPQRGGVSPLEFIPVAESSGLIGELGRFVLRTACEELVFLRPVLGDAAPPTVSVNLSRAQLRQPGLAADVMEVLHATGVAAHELILEVTESLAAQDEVVKSTLRELRALGVTLSLDDFGTGYSSLSCLHELPVNVVKIDRSFVSLALDSDYHRVMIEATIRMAQTLGLGTVAEGIETPAQAALMAELGCGKGQGYLYSSPLTVEQLVQWVQNQRARISPAAARHADRLTVRDLG